MDRMHERTIWAGMVIALSYIVWWLVTHPRWVAVQPTGIGQPLRGHGDALAEVAR